MYTKILVPVDGSETSDKALEHAARLASLCRAEIRLLHIVDPLVYANGFERPRVYLEQVLPAMVRAGHRILAAARKRLEHQGVPCDCHLVECDGHRVSELIVAHARSWKADLIVMGTHGRRGVNRVLMGSDAESVARTSPAPVLLVRPNDAGPGRVGQSGTGVTARGDDAL
ncbi:hypothetical protein AKI39_13105 [Bordetella sp. H567]|uniref:universal stress protein n=1 Tax=Bordetella sp. H567 TaxID=1697043 RepID=UPI00081C82CC|nr:universal stress protein [Bordetella sp. H567]AOB31427.1 hypothetical protein AKI39_13105 [Bordetella sp. H567]